METGANVPLARPPSVPEEDFDFIRALDDNSEIEIGSEINTLPSLALAITVESL